MNIKARTILRYIRNKSLSPIFETITHVRSFEPVAALTFDDGPHPRFTPMLLDLLAQYEAKATFFMVGEKAATHQDIVQQVLAQGHTIGNHSWSHPSFLEISRQERWAEVRRCEQALVLNGFRLFRPPYGHQNFSSRMSLFFLGYQVIGWNVAVQDWLAQTPREMADKLIQQIRPGSIVLLHDAIYRSRMAEPQHDRQPMLEALKMVLDSLVQQYRFVTIPNLLTYGRPVYKRWHRGRVDAETTF